MPAAAAAEAAAACRAAATAGDSVDDADSSAASAIAVKPAFDDLSWRIEISNQCRISSRKKTADRRGGKGNKRRADRGRGLFFSSSSSSSLSHELDGGGFDRRKGEKILSLSSLTAQAEQGQQRQQGERRWRPHQDSPLRQSEKTKAEKGRDRERESAKAKERRRGCFVLELARFFLVVREGLVFARPPPPPPRSSITTLFFEG